MPTDVGAQCTHGAVLSGARAALTALHGMGHKAQLELLGEGPLQLDVQGLVEVMATGRPPKGPRNVRERTAAADPAEAWLDAEELLKFGG